MLTSTYTHTQTGRHTHTHTFNHLCDYRLPNMIFLPNNLPPVIRICPERQRNPEPFQMVPAKQFLMAYESCVLQHLSVCFQQVSIYRAAWGRRPRQRDELQLRMCSGAGGGGGGGGGAGGGWLPGGGGLWWFALVPPFPGAPEPTPD